MKSTSYFHLIIITQMVIIGYLKYRPQRECSRGCHVTCANNARDWIRPIIRFQSRERLLSDTTRPARDVSKMMGFNEVVNATWYSKQHYTYTINMPSDIEGAPIEKLVCHIPGLSYMIGHKAALIREGGEYIPKAFVLPIQKPDFLSYQQLPENKEKFWIQKYLTHRGNKVTDIKDMDLDIDSLVQEYIGNPYIIDDRRFSIAVFVVLTSTNPARAYILNSDIVLRFCAKGYYPVDFTDNSTYVTDGISSIKEVMTEMKSIKHKCLETHYSNKNALNAHIQAEGKNPDRIYFQIKDAIRDVMNRTGALVSNSRIYDGKPKTHYYDITRWDFILDEDLDLYLLEVNHGPNMRSEPNNPWLLVNVRATYNMYRIIGFHDGTRFQYQRTSYIVRDSDVQVNNQVCYTSCSSCDTKDCYLCPQCLTLNQRKVLKEVFLEHINSEDSRLVLPFEESDLQKYNERQRDLVGIPFFEYNAMMSSWFTQKCGKDNYWCV